MASLSARLAWSAQSLARRLGMQGLAAVMLLGAAAAMVAYDKLVLEPRLAAAQQPVRVAVQTSKTAALPGLGQTAELPGWLQLTAEESGLELAQAQYELESGGPRVRYRATLPLAGTYPALRQFLAQTLNHYPNAALETLQLRRDSAMDEDLQIRLVLAFHLENAP